MEQIFLSLESLYNELANAVDATPKRSWEDRKVIVDIDNFQDQLGELHNAIVLFAAEQDISIPKDLRAFDADELRD